MSVPDLTGMTVEQATAALDRAGLVLAQLEPEFSDTDRRRLIARQDLPPTPASTAAPWSAWLVSKGPDLVAVPPLGGPHAAAGHRHADGRRPRGRDGHRQHPTACSSQRSTKASTCMPGQQLSRGSPIDITFA